jgi:hypothetical protein
MERYDIAAVLHRRRSRRGRHSGQDLGPPDPFHARLLVTFARALGCLKSVALARTMDQALQPTSTQQSRCSVSSGTRREYVPFHILARR